MKENKENERLSDKDKRKDELERIRKWIEERRKNKGKENNKENNNEAVQDEKVNVEINQQPLKDNKTNDDENLERKENKYPEEIQKAIEVEKKRLSVTKQSSSDFAKIKLRLDYLEKIQWIPETYENIDVKRAMRILDKEHYGMKKLKEEIIEYIYVNNKLGKINNEGILLSGPPGTGKTSIANQIAKALNRELYKLPLGGLNDDVYIKGAARQYGNSKPGAIVDILFKADHRKIVILLDEIDKLGKNHGIGDGAAALLDALDHDNRFVDRFLDLPIDLSDIVFVATANEKSYIPPVLLDRMNEIDIMPYSKEEKYVICKKFIIPREKKNHGLSNNMLRIEKKVIYRIVEEDYENAGIRGVTKKIRKICRFVSKSLLESGNQSYYLSLKRAINLGVISDRRYNQITKTKAGKVITSGIDYSTGKEALLDIESIYIQGKEEPTIIGVVKNMHQDVIMQLWSYIVAHKKGLNILESQINNGSITTNVEELCRYGYDSNHKLTIFCSMYSALSGVVLPQRHVICGNVSLLGEVKSNGKTLGHVINAINCGAEVLIFPKDIEHGVKKLTKDKNITLYSVEDLVEMYKLFHQFYFYNCINNQIAKDNNQVSLNVIKVHEKEICSLIKKKNISIDEAFNKYFDLNQDTVKNDAEAQLNKLVGLESIKSVIDEIISWQEVSQKRKEFGLKVKNIGLHMVFTGNPGTGKTTVAKILGKLLYKKKLVKNDRFVEVTRDDLVGKYIGHTEEKVKKVIENALGGVLYIDEAHSLYVNSDKDYGKIVISTLVKAMEEKRDELVIIMSGYKEEMSEMVKLNIGLSDRINYKINFDDYSVDELSAMIMSLCEEEEYKLEEKAVHRFKDIIKECLMEKREHFSNGRFVRNIFEKAKIKQAIRIGQNEHISEQDFKILTLADLQLAYEEETMYDFDDKKEISIGF